MAERRADERSLSELRPVRLADWNERDGIVVVECPKPGEPWYREPAAWFSWWTGPQRIKLDEIGSQCWRRFDGRTSLTEIGEAVAADHPDDVDKLETRIGLFLRVLIDRRMVRLE